MTKPSMVRPQRFWLSRWRGGLGILVGLLFLCLPVAQAEGLYAQPPFSAAELDRFIDDLPRFRDWLRTQGERVHPVVQKGQPSFVYSEKVARHVQGMGWKPERFFCVMGRSAAALAILEKGKALTDNPPATMPKVSLQEMEHVHNALSPLLRALMHGEAD